MGLDMYLTKKTYIGANYDHNNVVGTINITKNGTPININFNRVSYIEEQVGYWRKANAIHNFFVNNVMDEDDCLPHYVSKEQLQQLLDLCNKVKDFDPNVDNEESLEDLLPTTSGFFFGSTEYDEYYLEDIKSTIPMLESVLKELEDDSNASIYYQASW